jgi:hypothetical protein
MNAVAEKRDHIRRAAKALNIPIGRLIMFARCELRDANLSPAEKDEIDVWANDALSPGRFVKTRIAVEDIFGVDHGVSRKPENVRLLARYREALRKVDL